MRHAKLTAAFILATLASTCLLLASDGRAAEPRTGGSAANTSTVNCDRACLKTITDQYMAALVKHDPSTVPWAPHVKFTENNVPLKIGDGLWNTITRQGAYKLYFADPATGESGFYGLVEEGSQSAIYGMRLKVAAGKISEVETLLARKRTYRDDFPDPKGLKDTPILSTAVAPAQRRTREQLISIADSYFKTLQQNDGTIYAPFDKHCDRVEDGVHTTNNPKRASSSGNAGPALGCEAQFKTGNFRFVTHIRDRRYPLVDEERGLVLASTFFDHAGNLRTVTLKDGSTRPIGSPFDMPYSFVIFELFKIVDGKIRQVEAVLEDVPYKTRSQWPPAMNNFSANTTGTNTSPPCNRECLHGFVDQYLSALTARDPKRLPWAQSARFTENGVALQPGDGLWQTATGLGTYKLNVDEPEAGETGAIAVVVENGAEALLALRLKIEGGKIAEAETQIARKGEGQTLITESLKSVPAVFTERIPAADQPTREELVTIVNHYFDAIEQVNGDLVPFADDGFRIENGIRTCFDPTAVPGPELTEQRAKIRHMTCKQGLSSGIYSYIKSINPRRHLVVDVEHGIVYGVYRFNHPGTVLDAQVKGVGTVSMRENVWASRPTSALMAEVFKIKDRKIVQVAATIAKVPYRAPTGWEHAGHAPPEPEPSAYQPIECDRACLDGFADRYMAALLAHDPSRLPWAEHVTFTENNVPLAVGDGLWATVDSLGKYKLRFADAQAGEAGFFGDVIENGHRSPFSLRLRIENGKITEVETAVSRRPRDPALPDLVDKPIFTEVSPPEQRSSREQLITLADSYFATLQQNSGTLFAPFADTCNRVENGSQTTNNNSIVDYSAGADIKKLGCAAQFKTGFFRYVTRIRDRRFVLVDEERGLVLAVALFDHAGAMKTVKLTDGRTVPAQFEVPWTWHITELFKVKDGKLQQIEALVLPMPYNTFSVWNRTGER